MEEPRRLQFTTIGPSNREKKKPVPSQTIRINLDLTETNDDSCPEFSYVELLKNAVGDAKDGENGPESEPDPFGDYKEDDKLAEIAKKFEAKYGPKPGKGKRKPDRIQDLVDLGEGYDETDNFIDNSEAYDEIVPACLTTKLGGFYINSGVLDFREVSDDSEDAFSVNGSAKKKRKAQRLTSESESDGEVVLKKKRGPKPKKKFHDGFAGKKRKRLSAEGEKLFKRPKKPIDKWKRKKRSPTVSELLKQHAASTTSVNGTEGSSGPTDPSGNLHNGTNIDSAIESVISRVHEDNQSDEKSSPDTPETVPKLPEGLSARLHETITKLKKAAKDSREGKCRFFTHEVNRMLLFVELESQKVSCGTRQVIYIHLAAYLPCSKETLLKRAKKLRLNENDDKLKEPIQRLRDAIDVIMPAQLERHAQECRLAAQVRMMEDKELTREDASTESDDEKSGASEGEKKRHMSPRRKFEWSPETRVLLCEIVSIKMKTYDLSKLRAQSAEEYLKSFLDAEIKPLWPKGWMQTRMLYKESRTAHDPWTNPARSKKPPVITKAADSGTRSVGNSQDGANPRPAEASSKVETGPAGPVALVSSTDDKIQRELKPGHAGLSLSDPMAKCQVSSTNKGSVSVDIPTLLDYAGHSMGSSSQPKVTVDSTVSSSRSAVDLGVKPVRKPSVVDLTSPCKLKTEETDTHNIAMEILKSMRQIPQVVRPQDSSQPAARASTSNKPTSAETSNSSFLAQFKKYATSALSEPERNMVLNPSVSLLQDSKAAATPQSQNSSNSTKTEQTQKWVKGKAGEVSSSAHSLPAKQVSPTQTVSPTQRVSPQQEKAHSSERKQSPFTLLHQQLQQQQQKQKPRQPDSAARPKDGMAGKTQQSKSPQVSPGGGTDKTYLSKEVKPSPHPHMLNQQIQQQIQQNYLSMLHKSHGVGQSKPPQPPNSAQAAKRQSLLAAAISNSGVVGSTESSHSQGSAVHKASATQANRFSPQQAPAAAAAAATTTAPAISSSQDRPVNKAQPLPPPRTSHSSSHSNQTPHSASALSLKKKLISDSHAGHSSAATTSSQMKRPAKPATMAHSLTAAQSQASLLASQSAAWNLLSFANSSSTPPTAHSSSALANAALSSAFSPPLAHAQIQGGSRSSPNYAVSVLPGGKKTPSPTSSLHHQSRSPDNGRAVVSSTVPYSQAQLSPRSGLSPHGSPLGSLFANHSLHSPNSSHTAASPHSIYPPLHGSPLQHPFTFGDLTHYRFQDSSRSPHGY